MVYLLARIIMSCDIEYQQYPCILYDKYTPFFHQLGRGGGAMGDIVEWGLSEMWGVVRRRGVGDVGGREEARRE